MDDYRILVTPITKAEVDRFVDHLPWSVAAARRGDKAAMMFLIGQVLRQTRGMGNPTAISAHILA